MARTQHSGIDLAYVLPIVSSGSTAATGLVMSFDLGLVQIPHRNMGFIGREYLLDRIEKEISHERNTAGSVHFVLYGMGGIGKTQLALEYINRHFRDYSATFWVDASTTETVHKGFLDIMQELIDHHAALSGIHDNVRVCRLLGVDSHLVTTEGQLQVQETDEVQVIKAVQRFLKIKENTRWLLVFDNADDLETVELQKYIPSCSHGTVLITSRRRESALERLGFEVEQMNADEAEHLLFKSAKRSTSGPGGMNLISLMVSSTLHPSLLYSTN